MNELAIIVDTSLNDVHSLHWLRLLWHWTPWWKKLSQDDYEDFYGEYDDYGDDGGGSDYEYGVYSSNDDDQMEWWWQYDFIRGGFEMTCNRQQHPLTQWRSPWSAPNQHNMKGKEAGQA